MAQLADIVNIFCQTKKKQIHLHLPRICNIFKMIFLQDGGGVGGDVGGAV